MKNKLKRITAISAIITFISFIYKLVLSYLNLSMVLLIASISTFLIFIVKLLFVKNLTKSRANKKKAYFFMTLALLFYSFIFIAFVVLKINGIDISIYSYNRIEKGTQNPTVSFLYACCHILNCDMNMLFDFSH